MRTFGRACTAVAALFLPAFASAQVTSVFGRTGAVTAKGGDYNCAEVTNCPSLSGGNTWSGRNTWTSAPTFRSQVNIVDNPEGRPTYKAGTTLGVTGPDGTGSNIDIISFVGSHPDMGYSGIQAETYGCTKAAICAVGADQPIAHYSGAAYDGSGDPTNASMIMVTTEAQSSTHNGTDIEWFYTPNASTAFTLGMSLSPQGRGGVTIGGRAAVAYAGPTDLGRGTLNAASDIGTGGHFRSEGAAPKISSCGASPTVVGTDAAGAVGTGGAVSSCTISFAKAYASPPICIVQTFANAAPVAYVSAYTETQVTVRWNSSFHGSFFYMCQGAS